MVNHINTINENTEFYGGVLCVTTLNVSMNRLEFVFILIKNVNMKDVIHGLIALNAYVENIVTIFSGGKSYD